MLRCHTAPTPDAGQDAATHANRRCDSRNEITWRRGEAGFTAIGQNWLVGEVVRAGLEAADPVRDNGVDLLVSAPDYSWTQPIQIKTHRGRDINVYPQYVRGRFPRIPILVAYTLLGDSEAPMPAQAEGVFLRSYNDYSPRLLVLTPAEAWALPTASGKSDADPDSTYQHRLSWVFLARNGHLPTDALAEHRGQLLTAFRAGRERRRVEMAAQADHESVQVTSDVSAAVRSQISPGSLRP